MPMMESPEELREKVRNLIEAVTSPKKMTKREAIDFLEELSSDIDGMIDGLKDEIRNEDDADV